jgi:hypothetical protein
MGQMLCYHTKVAVEKRQTSGKYLLTLLEYIWYYIYPALKKRIRWRTLKIKQRSKNNPEIFL